MTGGKKEGIHQRKEFETMQTNAMIAEKRAWVGGGNIQEKILMVGVGEGLHLSPGRQIGKKQRREVLGSQKLRMKGTIHQVLFVGA